AFCDGHRGPGTPGLRVSLRDRRRRRRGACVGAAAGAPRPRAARHPPRAEPALQLARARGEGDHRPGPAGVLRRRRAVQLRRLPADAGLTPGDRGNGRWWLVAAHSRTTHTTISGDTAIDPRWSLPCMMPEIEG